MVRTAQTEDIPPAPARRLFGRAFFRVICAQMSFNYCFSTFLLLPKYLSTELHASASDLGHVTAIQGVTAVIAVPFVSSFVDRVGRRPLMAAGALLSLVYALCWLGITHIGPAALALQVLSGLAFMAAFSGSSTLVADLAPADRLSQAIGVFGAANISMNALAPAIAEPVAAHFGWRAAFLIAAGFSCLSLLLTRAVDEPARAAHTRESPLRDLLTTLRVAKRMGPYALAMATCGAAFGAVFTFYQPCVLAQGAKNVPMFFVGFTAAAVLTRVGLGSLADRFGRRRVALPAFTMYALVVLSMTQLTPGRLLGFGLAFGFAHGFFYPALNALALENTLQNERGRAMTLVSGAFHLGNTLSVLAFGWVAQHFGFSPVFVLAACVAFAGLAVLYASAPKAAAPLVSPAE